MDNKNKSKIGGLYDKYIAFCTKNSYLSTSLYLLAAHWGLVIIMSILEVKWLIIYNSLAVALYIFCSFLSIKKKEKLVYFIMIIEILSCSFVSTVSLGWNAGFFQYIPVLLTVIGYFSTTFVKDTKFKVLAIPVLLIFTYGVYCALHGLFATTHMSIRTLSSNTTKLVFTYNSLVSFAGTWVFIEIWVTELAKANRRLAKENVSLKYNSDHDPLTGFLNRRGFLPIVEKAINNYCNKTTCIAICDIDDFKHVNDSYGHDVGDEVLKMVSRVIREEFENKSVCRWGGEEMVILLDDTNMVQAVCDIDRLRQKIEKEVLVIYKRRISVTITIGLVQYIKEFGDANKFVAQADRCLYYGKENGKNKTVFRLKEDAPDYFRIA